MKTFHTSFFWICIYLALVLTPLLVLQIGEMPTGSGFWWNFSMAIGFAAMAMMGIQFLLTARFRRASAPFGIDIIYYFHRYLAVMALSFIFLHYLIIRISSAEALGKLNPLDAPFYMTAGRISLLLFVLLIVTSVWRKTLRIHYDEWRILHIVLAMSAFILAMLHIEGVGYYIHAPAKRWLWSGYTLFWLSLIIYLRLIKPWQMYKNPYRVVEVRQEHGNSWTLALKPDGHEGMCFKPGQFAWLTLRDSPWHVREHPFSFSSSALNNEQVEFTIKELGDFTRTIKKIQPGETAYLDGPYGVFTVDLYHAAPGFVFIAGGIGTAPIVSMLRTLADRQEERPLWFFCCNNRWQDVTFRRELEALQERLDLRLIHILVEPPDNWEGKVGFITGKLLREVLPDDAGKYEYFMCGPGPMCDAAQLGLKDMQVPQSRVHFELFNMV